MAPLRPHKGGLSIEEATGELGLGCLNSLGSQRKEDLREGSGISLGRASAAHFSPGCKSCGETLEFRRCKLVREEQGEEKGADVSPEGKCELGPLS